MDCIADYESSKEPAGLTHPSAGRRSYTRLWLSQISGRVLGEDRCPLATNFKRSGMRLAGMDSCGERHVVLPSLLPACTAPAISCRALKQG